MNDSKTMSDDDFLVSFFDCSIPAARFDHHGHVRVAWLMLRRFPLNEAIDRTCAGIAQLAAHLGVPGKYHRTLSEVGVHAVREKLREYLQASANGHTIIMHEMIAVLMMSLSQNKLVTTKHNQVDYA